MNVRFGIIAALGLLTAGLVRTQSDYDSFQPETCSVHAFGFLPRATTAGAATTPESRAWGSIISGEGIYPEHKELRNIEKGSTVCKTREN